MKRHQTRMRENYIDAGGALLGIVASLAGIYLPLCYGYPLQTLLAEGARDALAVATAAIYVAAQTVPLGACRLRTLNSRLMLKLDLNACKP
jgi:hypothetical protein